MRARLTNRCLQSSQTGQWLVHLLLLAVLLVSLSPAAATSPPDIILIVLDDVGIENFDFYGWRGGQNDPPYADTSFLSAKFDADELTVFTNAWSNPYCSPTRASFHTGDYAFRTGIGNLVNDDDTYGLDVDDTELLPKLLASTDSGTTGYQTALFGKWHLGTSADQDTFYAPLTAGYGYYAVLFLQKQDAESELGAPYFKFTVTTPGVPPNPVVDNDYDAKVDDADPLNDNKTIYATHEIFDRAISWINDREGSGQTYFVNISLFAAHQPVHCPFEGANTAYPFESFECNDAQGDQGVNGQFRSMIETIDVEIERLISETSTNPLVIIVSDNGTSGDVLDTTPWNSSRTKGTVFQGGILVPSIAFGDTVQGGVEISESVNLNDLYATILDFAGKSELIPSATDSKSLKDLMTGASSTAPHIFNYTETFFPNFEPGTGFGPCRGQQAVQEDPGEYPSGTYKYIRRMDNVEALYNLDNDELETNNLISAPPSSSRLADLEDHIDLTLDSDLAEICAISSKKGIGETCSQDSDCCSNDCSDGSTPVCVCPMQ